MSNNNEDKDLEEILKGFGELNGNEPVSEEEEPKTEKETKEEVEEDLEDMGNLDKPLAKDKFVKVVDFLFYGGTINGKTIKDMDIETRIKLRILFIMADAKLESKCPNYKEKISELKNETYASLNKKVAGVKSSLKDEYVKIYGEEGYQKLATKWEDVKGTVSTFTSVAGMVIEDKGQKLLRKLNQAYDKFKNKK